MSSRQMRRLQDWVDRSAGLDASDRDDSDDEAALPSTMATKKAADRHHDKKKNKKEKEKRMKAEAERAEAALAEGTTTGKSKKSEKQKAAVSAPPATPTASASPQGVPTTFATAKAKHVPVSNADDWEEVEDDESSGRSPNTKDSAAPKKKAAAPASSPTSATAASAPGNDEAAALAEEERRRKKKEEKKKLRQQQQRQMQAEEDALLEAALAQNAEQAGAGGSGGGPSSPNTAAHRDPTLAPSSSCAADIDTLQHFVMACDVSQLDTRLERIRMFGADAVEDVGDGRTPHRRADGRVRDTGSVSFFPVHHMNIKFVQSALATPNRYRWAPYDSLGIYLTTDQVRDASGQSWWCYALNCNSGAFQRALAALRSCQERMAGVAELVQCLAKNRLYHIPTLLQCVYTMEATGESAFAGELLEVALYQVGLLLRRFALSGTWSQRQLPSTLQGNVLIFDVLQRGVHAALKKGCLRTAYERTRCLLSLDASDPCGMLLLLDYTALRAKRWAWLLELRHRAMTMATHTSSSSSSSAASSSEAVLCSALVSLPNYAFSWALAKHFLEREERRHRSGEGGGRASKVLRGLTDDQRAALAVAPSAEALLSEAMQRFPLAAVRLLTALGGVETICGDASDHLPMSDRSVWFSGIAEVAEKAEAAAALDSRGVAAVSSRVAELFLVRHTELWKLNECVALLRGVLQTLISTPMPVADAAQAPRLDAPRLQDYAAYAALTAEAVMGESVAPIPADLLRPDAAELAMMEGDAEDPPVDPAIMDELMRILQQHRDNANNGIEAAQAYLRQLGHRIVGGGGAEGADVEGDGGAGGGDEGVDWYDVDDEEAVDVEGQEWFSVASGDDQQSEGEQ